MKKALFIDRDGTLIIEPQDNYQVDSLERLEFMPGVFRCLYLIRNLMDYELVMVSNQDGLGTPSYPEESFARVQEKLLKGFSNEGIEFDEILINKSLPGDKDPGRKPGTGMLGKYTGGDYDLAGSYVIGDRRSDIELAANLGARGILIGSTRPELTDELSARCALQAGSWQEVFSFLRKEERRASISRKTRETEILVDISLSGTGACQINTGIGFFDHMLEQVARHSSCDLIIQARGDLHVDEHHTVEDVAICLGEAVNQALGNRKGIERYAFLLPMDESQSYISMDLGGRSWLDWHVDFRREKIGDLPTELFEHFFRSFSSAARCSLHVKTTGKNEHHMAEAVFKAFGRVLKQAVRQDINDFTIPSTKGSL